MGIAVWLELRLQKSAILHAGTRPLNFEEQARRGDSS